MAIIGSLSTLRAQLAHAEHFAATFAYVEQALQPGSVVNRRIGALPLGTTERVELAGGAFALEQVYETKGRSNGFFESHKAYIDVQVIVEGEEYIEWADIRQLRLKEDKTPAKDVLVYEMFERAAPLRLTAGEAAVLFPVDGHMPGIRVAGAQLLRKVVVKVPVMQDGARQA